MPYKLVGKVPRDPKKELISDDTRLLFRVNDIAKSYNADIDDVVMGDPRYEIGHMVRHRLEAHGVRLNLMGVIDFFRAWEYCRDEVGVWIKVPYPKEN